MDNNDDEVLEVAVDYLFEAVRLLRLRFGESTAFDMGAAMDLPADGIEHRVKLCIVKPGQHANDSDELI